MGSKFEVGKSYSIGIGNPLKVESRENSTMILSDPSSGELARFECYIWTDELGDEYTMLSSRDSRLKATQEAD